MNTTIQQIIIDAFQSGSWLTLVIVFWAGAVLSLSSCTLIRIPVIIGYIGGVSSSKRKAFLITLFFVMGTILSYILLGILLGFISGIVADMVKWSRYFYYVVGSFALFFGLQLSGLIDLGIDSHKIKKRWQPKGTGLTGAFVFGMIFAIFEAPACPCCGPALFIIASHVFIKANYVYAILMFFSYALGQSFPLLLLGGVTGIMKYSNWKVHDVEKIVKIIAGNLLIVLAIIFFILG